jgi:DNA transformation protein
MGKLTIDKDDSFVEFICDQLDDFDIVTYKPMFGGYGLYSGILFFGIVFNGRLYFKTNETTQSQYEEWEMEPFQPNATQRLKSYFEVPPEALDNSELLCRLAEEAANIVHHSSKE